MTDTLNSPAERLMRIVHCSDLHFGTEQPDLTRLLLADIDELQPDLVIVSGDFTQTAIRKEFEAARDFLQALKRPTLTIPGNHDLPRYNLLERFINPYRQYRRYIDKVKEPVFRQPGVCIAGINTARRIVPHWNWAHGAISRRQLVWLKDQFEAEPVRYRICVMHHPIWAVTQAKLATIVFGGKTALSAFKDMKINLVLSGHVHHAAMQAIPADDRHKVVFLSASTALSHRLRGQKNGFNVIDLYDNQMQIEIRGYVDNQFRRLEFYQQNLA